MVSKTCSLSPASEIGMKSKKRKKLRMVIFNPALTEAFNVNLPSNFSAIQASDLRR
jgi:hypothetical protein